MAAALHARQDAPTLAPMTATVESLADEKAPGRTDYRITGATAAVVQEAIDTLMATVDTAFGGVPGVASFIGPRRDAGGWAAIGAVRKFQTEGATA